MTDTVAAVLITWGALIALVVIVRMVLAYRKATARTRTTGEAK